MQKRIITLAILFLIVLCFIWGNSMLSVEVSSKISSAVGEILKKFFGGGENSVAADGMSVRKLAHFVEFCALGVTSSLLLKFCVRNPYVCFSLLALLGMFIPIVDETIQIFSGRGPSIRDVWIDIGGYVLGCLLVFLYLYLKMIFAKKDKKQL